MSPCPCLHISGIPQKENGTNEKRQFPFVFCKRKMERANFRLLAAKGDRKTGGCFLRETGKRAVVFLGRQTINGN
jgi:hypothetical protein